MLKMVLMCEKNFVFNIMHPNSPRGRFNPFKDFLNGVSKLNSQWGKDLFIYLEI